MTYFEYKRKWYQRRAWHTWPETRRGFYLVVFFTEGKRPIQRQISFVLKNGFLDTMAETINMSNLKSEEILNDNMVIVQEVFPF